MFKKMLIKKMIKSKTGVEIPDEELDKIIMLVEKNPTLFKQIGEEAQVKTKAGMSQEDAMKEVMLAHKDEIQEAYKS